MNNNLFQNSFRSSVTSRDSSKGKYQKFKHIIRSGTHPEQNIQQWDQSVSHDQKSIDLKRKMSQAKSNASIRSHHTPSKLPATPMKNIFTSYSSKCHAGSSFKSLLSQIEIIKHQFNIFVQKMSRQINRTIQIVLQSLEAGIVVFLRKQLRSSESNISISPKRERNKSKDPQISGAIINKLSQQQILQGMLCQNKIVRTESIKTFVETESPRKHFLNTSIQHEQKNEKSSFFSNTIRVREELKNDAKNPHQKIFLQPGQNSSFGNRRLDLLSNRGSRISVTGREQSREVKKSVQKLQSQLRSLKNLLSE